MILNLVNTHIPKLKLKNSTCPPWIDSEVITLSRKKEPMRKRARQSNNPDFWASYRRHHNRLRALTNEKYNSYIANSCNSVASNPKRFGGIVRSKTKCKSLPVEIKDGEHTVSSDVR